MLYAVLDACDAPAVPPKVAVLGEHRAVSLYRGDAAEQLADIAPYLVTVDEDVLDWILTTLWGDAWGILIQSTASIAELRTHLRKFLIATAPNGEELYFRFYDPRVLPAYLDTCTPQEVADMYGPITSFGVASNDTGFRWLRIATPQDRWAMENPSVAPRPKIVFKMPPRAG